MNSGKRKLDCKGDRELIERLRRSLSNERESATEFIGLLAEMLRRRTHLRLGYRSLNEYCIEALGLSENQAYRRAACAAVVGRFPRVLALLATGDVHMTNIAMIAKHLNDENFDEVVAATRGRRKHEVEAYLAERFGTRRKKNGVRATGAKSFELTITIDASTKALLDRARALRPDEDLGELFEMALAGLVEKLHRAKFKTTDRPRSDPPTDAPEGARPISNAVKRAVYERDGGRCTFVSEDGRRCTAESRLEFDHVRPVALGGRSTVEGVRLLCRAHNQYEAERQIGRAHVESKRTERRRTFSQENSPPAMVIPALRALEITATEAKRLVRHLQSSMEVDADEETWVRAALAARRSGAVA